MVASLLSSDQLNEPAEPIDLKRSFLLQSWQGLNPGLPILPHCSILCASSTSLKKIVLYGDIHTYVCLCVCSSLWRLYRGWTTPSFARGEEKRETRVRGEFKGSGGGGVVEGTMQTNKATRSQRVLDGRWRYKCVRPNVADSDGGVQSPGGCWTMVKWKQES